MKKFLSQLPLAMALAMPAAAADLGVDEPIPPITEPAGFEARWQFTASVYLWMPGINGKVGVAGLDPVDVDASFADLVQDLDFAFMGVAEARYDRFAILTDLMYTKLSVDGTGPLGVFNADATSQLIIGTLMGEYRVVEQGKNSVDLMAGARVWSVNSDLDITSGIGVGASFSDDEYWVDPMIGVRGRLQGASPFYLTGWAMVGGFGVSSEIDWDLFGGVGYECSDRFSLVAGYRAVGVDYSNDGFVFDVIQHGPILGGVFRF